MSRSAKREYPKSRKPIILIVCEGRNKSETLYFNHFNLRNAPYRLIIKGSEATDIKNMAVKADWYFKDFQMDKKLGDRAFCLIDLDLDKDKYAKYEASIKKYKNIEFIVSNPCFEIWLLYYFTENPKVVNSSQAVKELMGKYVEDYQESTDVIEEKKLHNQYAVAINRSEKKNNSYKDIALIDKNPYTEIQNVVLALNEKIKQ